MVLIYLLSFISLRNPWDEGVQEQDRGVGLTARNPRHPEHHVAQSSPVKVERRLN